MNTCKITKQLAQTFQTRFNRNDRLISLKCLALFDASIYPRVRQHIFLTCLNEQDISTQLIALQVLPLMQYNLQTRMFLSIFYSKYCCQDVDIRLKPVVINVWKMHRCLFDIDGNTVRLQVGSMNRYSCLYDISH
jgi:hypothetical protein